MIFITSIIIDQNSWRGCYRRLPSSSAFSSGSFFGTCWPFFSSTLSFLQNPYPPFTSPLYFVLLTLHVFRLVCSFGVCWLFFSSLLCFVPNLFLPFIHQLSSASIFFLLPFCELILSCLPYQHFHLLICIRSQHFALSFSQSDSNH